MKTKLEINTERMEEHLKSILTDFNLRTDLIDSSIIDGNYHFKNGITSTLKWKYYNFVCGKLGINNKIRKNGKIN